VLFRNEGSTDSTLSVLLRTSTPGETRCFDSTVWSTEPHQNNKPTVLYNNKLELVGSWRLARAYIATVIRA
jgi:hypothetical protein